MTNDFIWMYYEPDDDDNHYAECLEQNVSDEDWVCICHQYNEHYCYDEPEVEHDDIPI